MTPKLEEGPSSFARFQRPKGARTTLLLALSSLGIIYGDIGTSPLYVMNAIFPASGPLPSKEDVIGACSAVIWAITIVPLIKYALIALQFENGTGEGGPFAVFTALYPPAEEVDENRALTTYTTTSVSPTSSRTPFLQRKSVRGILFGWVLFGTALTISDGLLTPAVSVVSAVGGMAVGVPRVASSIVGISCAILVVLFLFQGFGTRKVSALFAPVVAGWMAILLVSGIINVIAYPGIFRAFDPSRAVMLFVRTKEYDLLAGVLLAITGVEAMFANLGQFSAASIRIGFCCIVYPCLIFAYLGQGAKLITTPETALPNVFFNTIPGPVSGGFWWFTWIFAVLAAVVASQAMITATFSLVQQLTTLHVIPHLKIVHTNDTQEGQVFVPAVNILVMIGTIGLTVGFGTDAGLTNAYGFAVSGVLIVTTSILAIAIVELKHLPVFLAVGFFLASGFVDGLFWGASLKKVPHGAWFSLGLAVVLWVFFQFWTWAKGLESSFDASHRHRLGDLIGQTKDMEDDKLGLASDGTDIVPAIRQRHVVPKHLQLQDGQATRLKRLPVFALFHNTLANTLNGAPHTFSAFLKCYPSLPEVTVMFTIRRVGVPHTLPADRYTVTKVRSFEGMYVATLRLGYRDDYDLVNVGPLLRERIVALEASGNADEVAKKVATIDHALATAVTHFLPHFHVTVDRSIGGKAVQYARQFLIETIYRRLKVNFDETDGYVFENDEQVLRMGIAAAL